MEFVLILALMALVVIVVAAPLRRERLSGGGPAGTTAADVERRELEAARDAKLREIRDAELDRETGKLSAEDYDRVDAELRAEAVQILRALDELDAPPPD